MWYCEKVDCMSDMIVMTVSEHVETGVPINLYSCCACGHIMTTPIKLTEPFKAGDFPYLGP